MPNEYASLAEVKDWLGIPDADNDQDDILEILLEGVSRKVDDYCGRRFYLDDTTSIRFYTTDDPGHIFIEDVDSAAPTISVETDDNNDGVFERSWTRDNVHNYGFRLEPLNAAVHGRPYTAIRTLANVFPRTNRAVRITAKHGYATDPPPQVKTAMLLQVQAVWTPSGVLEETEGLPGVDSLQLEGSDSVSFSKAEAVAAAARELSTDAKDLLDPLVRLV